MRAFAIVEAEVFGESDQLLLHCCVPMQINVFVLHVAPESFDKYIVKRAPPPIHTDGDFFAFEYIGKGNARELRALVAIKYFRLPVAAQGVVQTIHAKYGIHAVADPKAQHPSRIPVHDRDQIHKAMA